MQWTFRFLLITFCFGFFITDVSADLTLYEYDDFGRIKEIYYQNKWQRYIYDDVGNRLENTIGYLNPGSIDTDNDGLPNLWESEHGLNPFSAHDATLDTDNDGLTNIQEFQANTDPNNVDTDGDGISDSQDPEPTFNVALLIPILHLML